MGLLATTIMPQSGTRARFLPGSLRRARRRSDIRSNPTISERFHPSASTGGFQHSTSTRTDHTCGYGLEHRNVKTGVEVLSDRHLDRGGWVKSDRKSTRLNSSHTVISYAV